MNKLASGLLLLLISISPLHATVIDFKFDGPAWPGSPNPFFGSSSTLTLSVDNGTNNVSQDYFHTDVLSASLVSSNGNTLLSWTVPDSIVGQGSLLSTNALGTGVLTLGGPTLEFIGFTDSQNRYFQLGSGAAWSYYSEPRLGTIIGSAGQNDFSEYTLTSRVTSNKVPEPSNLALFGLGLAVFGLLRRKKE